MEGGIFDFGRSQYSIHLCSHGAKHFRVEAKDTASHVFQNEWKVDGSGIERRDIGRWRVRIASIGGGLETSHFRFRLARRRSLSAVLALLRRAELSAKISCTCAMLSTVSAVMYRS